MKKGLLYLLALVLLVGSVSAEYYPSYPYDYPQYQQPTYPYGGGYFGGVGNFDFNSLYDRYQLFIDAIIFGFIFFGLGSIVWAGKQGYTPLYIGLGLFMTASLLLFESRSVPRLRLLDLAGPWAVAVLVILLALLIYNLIHTHLGGHSLIAGSIAMMTALWLLNQLSTYLSGAGFVSDWLIFITTSDLKGLIFFGAIGAFILGIFLTMKGKK